MPKINILNILSGDNQSTIVDKINYNFDQILSSGGGPQGQQGVIGATGPVGPQGIPGIQGAKGDKGNKWFVAVTAPTTASLGDFWLDVDSSDQSILEYQSGGWINTGYGLSSGDIFQRMNYIRGGGSVTADKSAVVLGGIGSGLGSTASTSLVLSDVPISTVGALAGYSPGQGTETYIRNVNQENSKLKITTDNRTNLISFSRGSLDVLNPTLNGLNNPTISWLSPSTSTNPYDISFKNPTGGISILTEGTLRGPIEIKSASDSVYITSYGVSPLGGVNILATQEVTAKSNADNISLLTASATKGTFIRFNSNTGFAEFNNDITNIANSNTPAFFVNSNGVGIGVGNVSGYTFKQTGADPRKLAVLGNVSISKSVVDHETTNMFIGINGESDYDKGSLFVRGHGGFGHNSPISDETSGLSTTGPSEAGKSFPRLFVTSSRDGQVFQVKNVIKTGIKAAVGRTTMGGGVFDYNAVTDKTSAGYGPDLTQEVFTLGYVFNSAPLMSLQHKITDATNVTDTATVFSITTFTIAGIYDSGTIADKTLIQTKNSNSNLRLFANATSSTNKNSNKVIIGARNNSLVAVFAGTDTDPSKGTVTIGSNAESSINKGLVGVFNSNRITFPSGDSNNHSLTVNGVQTIGTSDPYSAFSYISSSSVYYGTNIGREVGNVSMLKIQRGSLNSSGNATGTGYNNYANGLEIISYKTSLANPNTPNKSVGIIVASGTNKYVSPTTGFFVSDDGKNIGVNSNIDYTVGIKIGTTTDYQIPLQIGSRLWNTVYTTSSVLTSVSPIAAYFNGKIYVDGDLDVGKYNTGRTLRIFEGSVNNDDSVNARRRYLAISISGDAYVINATYNTTANPQLTFQTAGSTRAYIDQYGIKAIVGTSTNPSYSFSGITDMGMYKTQNNRNSTTQALEQRIGFSVFGNERAFIQGSDYSNYYQTKFRLVNAPYTVSLGSYSVPFGYEMTIQTDYSDNKSWATSMMYMDSGKAWYNGISKNCSWYFGSGDNQYQFCINTLVSDFEGFGDRQNLTINSALRVTNAPIWVGEGTYPSGSGSGTRLRVVSSYNNSPGAYAAHIHNWDGHGIWVTNGNPNPSTGGVGYIMVGATFGSGGTYNSVMSIKSSNGSYWSSSDIRFKKDINNINSSLDKIQELRPVTYKLKDMGSDEINYGLIAQELKEIYPDMVHEGPDGYLGITYTTLIPVLIKGIQELNNKVKSLEGKLND